MTAFLNGNIKHVKVGDEFSIKVPNSREIIINIDENDFDVTKINVYTVGTTSTPNPRYSVLSNNQIKLFFEEQFFNLGTSYKFLIHDSFGSSVISKVEEEVYSKWTKLSSGAKSLLKKIVAVVLGTLVGGALLVVDKKYNGAKIYNYVKSASVINVADKMEEGVSLDIQILTNNHPVYESEDFKEYEEDVNEGLKKYYWFVGNGLFMFKDIVKGDFNKPALASFDEAVAFCDKIGARLPYHKELESSTNRSITSIKGFEWQIKDHNKFHEWTQTELDGDYYYIFMKKAKNHPSESKMFVGKVGGHEDDTKSHFRCVMDESNFL